MSKQRITKVRPGITARGFRTAVKDYSEPSVIEELAANSYDADASTVLVLLDHVKQELHVIDNGNGFSRSAIRNAGVLGGGDKTEVDSTAGKRPYLGAYGFGLKATANIANTVRIHSVSVEGDFSLEIDWSHLEEALKSGFEGYDLFENPRKKHQGTGTHILLKLKNPTGEEYLDSYLSVLGNLPEDNGRFRCYVGILNKAKRESLLVFNDFAKLATVAQKLARRKVFMLSDPSSNLDLQRCTKITGTDRQDKSIKYTLYFTGVRGGKVLPLKTGLRGIYVKIQGRLLKHSFTDQRYVYPISKWVKFASGLRVELSIDWLRNEISLSRDDLKFGNPKLEEQFRSGLTRVVSGFIQPQLKKLEMKSARKSAKEQNQRIELAKKRLSPKNDLKVPGIKSGFNFIPETDSELAILLANEEVMKRINSAYRLLDYNDKAPFDCLVYDEARREFIFTELEPTLMEFLQHKNFPVGLTLIVTWSLGKWRVGARKRAKSVFLQLVSETGAKRGHYKLLAFQREKSAKPSAEFPVVVMEQVISKKNLR